MSEIKRDHFYAGLQTAPHAVRGFFENITHHFERKNDVLVHHTDTNDGDLRLAIPAEVLGRARLRNFATMYWQTQKQVVFTRNYLTPDELTGFGFHTGTTPKSATEPLKSDIRLDEQQWRYGVGDFIKVLEAAKIKMLNSYGV